MTLRGLLVAALVVLCSAGPALAQPREVGHEELQKALQRSRGLDGFDSVRTIAHRDRGTADVVAFSHRGELLAFSGARGGVSGVVIWRTHDWSPVSRIPVDGSIEQLIFSPDDRHLYVSGGGGGRGILLRARVATGTVVRKYEGHRAAISRMVLSPDGRTLASSGLHEDRLIFHDTASGHILHEQPVRGRWIYPSLDGRGILRRNTDRRWVLIPFRGTVAVEAALPDEFDPRYIDRSVPTAAGGLYAVPNGYVDTPWDDSPGTLTLHRLAGETLETLKEIRVARSSTVVFAAVSPDGRLVATVGWKKVVRFRTVPDLELVAEVRFPLGYLGGPEPTQLRFSPDSRFLAVGRRRPLPGLIRTDTFERFRPWTGHADRITALRFLPEGRRILTLGRDNTACIWDRSTLAPLRRTALPAGFNPKTLSPEGDRLLCVARFADRDDWKFARPAKIVSPETGETLHRFLIPKGFTKYADSHWLPGTRELLLTASRAVCRFDYVRGGIVRRIETPGRGDWKPEEEGRRIFTPTGSGKGDWDLGVKWLDLASGRFGRIEPPARTRVKAQRLWGFVPDRRHFHLAGRDLHIFNRATCEKVAGLSFPGADVWSFSFSGDGRRVAVVTSAGDYPEKIRERFGRYPASVVTVHDTMTGEILFARTSNSWCRVYLAPGGDALALVGSDGSLAHWTLPPDPK